MNKAQQKTWAMINFSKKKNRFGSMLFWEEAIKVGDVFLKDGLPLQIEREYFILKRLKYGHGLY